MQQLQQLHQQTTIIFSFQHSTCYNRGVLLEVDLYRLDPRGGSTQAVWRAEEQHVKVSSKAPSHRK